MTNRDVAKRLGIREETISRWKQDPAFAAQLEDARTELWQRSRVKLESLQNEALDAVRELLESPNEGTRLRASEIVLRACRQLPGDTEIHLHEHMSEEELEAELRDIDRKLLQATGGVSDARFELEAGQEGDVHDEGQEV